MNQVELYSTLILILVALAVVAIAAFGSMSAWDQRPTNAPAAPILFPPTADFADNDELGEDDSLDEYLVGGHDGDGVESDGAKIGDAVVYVFTDAQERRITVRLSANQNLPGQGIIHRNHPMGRRFLGVRGGRGAQVGDRIVVPAGGQERDVLIVGVTKPPQTDADNPSLSSQPLQQLDDDRK